MHNFSWCWKWFSKGYINISNWHPIQPKQTVYTLYIKNESGIKHIAIQYSVVCSGSLPSGIHIYCRRNVVSRWPKVHWSTMLCFAIWFAWQKFSALRNRMNFFFGLTLCLYPHGQAQGNLLSGWFHIELWKCLHNFDVFVFLSIFYMIQILTEFWLLKFKKEMDYCAVLYSEVGCIFAQGYRMGRATNNMI